MTRDDKISAVVFVLMTLVLTSSLMGMGATAEEPARRAAWVFLAAIFGIFVGVVTTLHWRRRS